jgi:hypothetical protein
MKKLRNSFKNTAVVLIAMVLAGYTASASTFTAVASGNWNSTATWGGTAPSYALSGFTTVNIPIGINVSIDNNLFINSTNAIVNISGELIDSATDTLTLGLGTLNGTGIIQMSSMGLQAGSTLVFTGTIAVHSFLNWSAGIVLAGVTDVKDTLYLGGGSLSVGSNLFLADNGVIILNGGSMTAANGALNNDYSVIYYGSSATTGAELAGAGLENLTINVPFPDSVTLSSDLTVADTLTLTDGYLVLNGYNLSVGGNIAPGGSATISSHANSSITINTTNSPSGSLAFTANADTVDNLNINVHGTGGMLSLGSDLFMNGSLSFSNGSLNIASYILHMNGSASVTGADSASYIIASGGGHVSAQLVAGNNSWTTFPIGSSIHYSPVSAQLNSGSASGYVSASVSDNVYAGGTAGNGSNLTNTQASVAMTYYVEPDSQFSSNLNLRVMWSANMEVNGFNRDSAYLSHYTNNAWDTSAITAASVQGSLYAEERDNLTSFSPFAVFGQNSTTSTGIAAINTADFAIYPNPASDYLMIKNISGGDSYNMTITDMTGQIVGSYTITGANNTVSVAGLTDGNYMIRLSNGQMTTVKKFVKM